MGRITRSNANTLKTDIMKKILLTLFLTISAIAANAQQHNSISDTDHNILKAALKGWNVRLSAGYLIGGTAPLPLPVEIRGINGFNPGLNFMIEGDAEKRFRNTGWGIRFGIRFDTKGMTTDASTKNYHMEMSTPDGSKIVGSWYGNVKTHVENIYLSVPLLATYSIGERWTLSAGAYASFLLHGVFDGEAYDGYIRDQNPTGEKTEVSSAGYDFSSDIRKFQWGLQGGAEYVVYKHLAVFANLQWGLNGIFPSDYSCVTFPLYPIYGTLGFSYLF